ncbi:MAG: hypothetical protein ACFB20_04085 [Opitutales bacterium]
MSKNYPNFDGRVYGKEPGEPDYHIPGSFPQKVLFVLFALGLTAVGAWIMWAPLARWVGGETSEARVVRIVRSEPGKDDEVIRYKKEIKEQAYTVTFQHFVAVQNEDGTEHIMRLGVDSAKKPYVSVNDALTVVHYPEDEVAFELASQRTWAFGVGYVSVGGILCMLSINSLLMVGRKIAIDPESDESIDAEVNALEESEDWRNKRAAWKRGEPVAVEDDPPAPTPTA